MGMTKMFGGKNPSPLQKFIDRGTLLSIDVAYARLQEPKGSLEQLALHAALLASARNGHLCLEKSFVEDPALAALLPEGRYYLPKYAQIEDQIVHHVKRLLSLPEKKEPSLPNTTLTDEQASAFLYALKYPFSLITGGPGTGKTHTAAEIAQAYSKVLVAAPTGKAAAHLASKIPAATSFGTLHSLLLEEGELDAELVLVDECSMIDPFLFARLLSAIGPETTLVLMGDIHQLPAVEGGSVFFDLVASEKIPTTTLTTCRRSDRQEILTLAEQVLHGTAKNMCNTDLGFSKNNLEQIYENLWHYIKDKDFSHFRILSTLRKGPLGVDALNRYLYEKFSPKADSFPIMITRNDRHTGLANGETGLLQKGEAIFGQRRLPERELPPFEYAYCLSVHKSQGSEYEEVLFLVPEGSENFGKEVLYTAVTRARHSLAIDGHPAQMAAALQKSSRKISGIQHKLKKINISC